MKIIEIDDKIIKAVYNREGGKIAQIQIKKVLNTNKARRTFKEWGKYARRIGAESVIIGGVIAGTDNVIGLKVNARLLPYFVNVYLEEKSNAKIRHDKGTQARYHGRLSLNKKIVSGLVFVATGGYIPNDTGCTIENLTEGQLYRLSNKGKGFERELGGAASRGVDDPTQATEWKLWNGQFELGNCLNNDNY